MVTLNTTCIAAIEVVDAQVGVGLPGAKNVVDGSQTAMGDRDRGFISAAASGDSVELSVEVARLRLDTRPGDLTHDGPNQTLPRFMGRCMRLPALETEPVKLGHARRFYW
jgi:hypothetical protein